MTQLTVTLTPDAELAEQLRDGDALAWQDLYDQHSVGVWNYVARLCGQQKDIVAEIVQEVFLAAAKGARTFDAERGTIRAWLTGIAHFQVASWYRQHARQRRHLRSEFQHQIVQLSGNQSGTVAPVLPLEQAELVEFVRLALAEMSAEYASLLVSKYMDHLSIQEIQEQSGGTSDSVRSKLRRARAEFRDVFARLYDGGDE